MTFHKIIFCIFLLLLIGWRYQLAVLKIENNQLEEYFGQTISLTGIVIEEPEKREKTTRLIVRIERTEEKILITQWHYPQYEYGDRLKITGSLQEPQLLEDFDYKDYLAKKGIFGLMYQPEMELLEKNQANPVKRVLISAKNRLKKGLNEIMPAPQSAFLEALLFGEENNISDEWKEKLNLSGTRHIAAVSGMNITILTFLVSDFLLFVGLGRSRAFYLSIVLIFFYISMVGAPASAVRAGIMACLFLTGQHIGRASSGSRAIFLTGTLMLFLDPLLLGDIGFQLSFLAVMGLVYLQPVLFNLFKSIPDSGQLRYNLSGTIAAQIFVFPILTYNFGQISFISPITNILILPLLPSATILGFISAFTSLVWQELGQFLSWPVWLMIDYLMRVVNWFSGISWSSLFLENVSWLLLPVFYSFLALIVWRLNKRPKLKFLKY